jgi:hypothetical protein
MHITHSPNQIRRNASFQHVPDPASTGFKGGIAGNIEAGPPSRLKRCST